MEKRFHLSIENGRRIVELKWFYKHLHMQHVKLVLISINSGLIFIFPLRAFIVSLRIN